MKKTKQRRINEWPKFKATKLNFLYTVGLKLDKIDINQSN